MGKIQVIHIETGRNLYGGPLQVLYLLRGLKDFSDIENVLMAPKESAILRQAQKERISMAPVSYSGEGDPRLFWSMVGQIRRLKKMGQTRKVILHAHSRRGADLWASLASRITGTPLVITRRVDNSEARALALFKYRQAQKVVAISRAIRDVLAALGVNRDKIKLIYSAVDTSLYRPVGDREWFNKAFGLPPESPKVGIVAQFIPRKGHISLLKAAKAVLGQGPQVRFLFFGKGPMEQKIRQEATSMGIGDRCIFLGFRDDLPRILPCLDIICHPALLEGLGVSLLQASACGVPIVATRAGGIPEVVRDGRTGILCEPGDVEEIARALLRLLRDKMLAEDMGREGRRMVEGEFSIKGMVTKYAALYRSLHS